MNPLLNASTFNKNSKTTTGESLYEFSDQKSITLYRKKLNGYKKIVKLPPSKNTNQLSQIIW